jgi:hypothetical protein
MLHNGWGHSPGRPKEAMKRRPRRLSEGSNRLLVLGLIVVALAVAGLLLAGQH